MLVYTLSSMSTSWLILTALAMLAVYAIIIMRKKPEMSGIPGYRTLPVVGLLFHAPYSLTQVIPTITKWAHDFPDICYGHLFNGHYVMLSSARAVEGVLTSKKLLEKGSDYEPMQPWFGQGLLTSHGLRWHTHRKLLTPAFHFSILDRFLEVINDHSRVLVDKLAKFEGRIVDVWPLVANATLDIICETAMGVKVGAQMDPNSKYICTVKRTTDSIFIQTVRPWLRWRIFRNISGFQKKFDADLKYLLTFSKNVIAQRRQQRIEKLKESYMTDENINTRVRLAFLDLLLEAAEKDKTFTEEDVREEVDTFMFEGHDTTTCGINWAIYNISRSPRVQQLIREEIDQVFGGDVCHQPTREQLGQLRYLECAIKESLRLFPPVTFYSRRVRSPINILGHMISPNTDVVINAYGVHRDPNHWDQPDEYIPERFLAESCKGRHPFSYIPFSAGLRNCIGQKFAMMEMKSVLACILRVYKMTCHDSDGGSMPATRMSLTLQKDGPLNVRFEAREDVIPSTRSTINGNSVSVRSL